MKYMKCYNITDRPLPRTRFFIIIHKYNGRLLNSNKYRKFTNYCVVFFFKRNYIHNKKITNK